VREDYSIRIAGGQTIVIDTTFAPLRDASGRVTQIVGSAVDVTARKLAEQKLAESSVQLRALLMRLQQAQEEERVRVARNIHDELGQLLTGLKMDVRWLERKLADTSLPQTLNPLLDRAVAASALADQTIAVVQRIAADLRPGALDRLGLGAALKQKGRWFEERTGVPCNVTVPETEPPLSAAVATELFYISQEALTNVTRHAQATEVQILFEMNDDEVVLKVWDNGRGITEGGLTTSQSLGMLGMRERAAHCGGVIVWERCEPQGTRLIVHIPRGKALAKTEESV
jgi:signal transduction histidine kinase